MLSATQVTELHPGNFIFYDTQQASYGSCTDADIGIYTLTRVVGHYPRSNTLLIDLGWTGCSKQGPGAGQLSHPQTSHRILQHPSRPRAHLHTACSRDRQRGLQFCKHSCTIRAGYSRWVVEHNFGKLLDEPNLMVRNLKQEAGEITTIDGSALDFGTFP